MDATSQISREARDVMIDNVHSGLSGVDLSLNRQRARENARTNFAYHTNKSIHVDTYVFITNCTHVYVKIISNPKVTNTYCSGALFLTKN